MSTADELITVRQAARELGMSVWWIYRELGRSLDGRRIGKRAVRVTAASVDALKRRSPVSATAAAAVPDPPRGRRSSRAYRDAVTALAELGIDI